MECPNCNQQNRPNAKFCAECGQAIMLPVQTISQVTCASCGQPLRLGAKFCSACGSSDALLDHLETQPTHILHFDGHGVFARQCPECGTMNYPHHTHGQAEHGCHQSLTGAKPYGYLAFEDEQTRHVKWMRSNSVGNLLSRRSVRLAILSACRSGGVGGEVLFSGTALALIQAGVPAVVSTQLPISASAAAKFMRGFYHALARFESLSAAVNAGRLRVPEREWFIPTLYLLSQDDEGHLFIQPRDEVREKLKADKRLWQRIESVVIPAATKEGNMVGRE